MSIFNYFRKNKSSPESELKPFDLDTPLVQLSPDDYWTIGNSLTGSIVFGITGSGKSSASGRALAQAMLAQDYGFLVLCAKPEEREVWEGYAKEAGRSDDVIVFGADTEYRFNPLDYEIKRKGAGAGLTENIVDIFITIMELSENNKGNDSGENAFWRISLQMVLRSAIELISIAKGTITLEDIYNVILSAPRKRGQAKDDKWLKKSYCAQLMKIADEKFSKGELSPMQEKDLEVTLNYFFKDFAVLDSKPKSIIQTTFTGLCDRFLRGELRELFCTDTNIVPDVCYKSGAILILDMPIKTFGMVGVVAQGMFKYIFQQAMERRIVKDEEFPRPVALWMDEAQFFLTERRDREFQSTARSSRTATVMLSQSIDGFRASLGEWESNALLSNLATKFLHANVGETNKWASEMIGQIRQYKSGFSASTSNQGDSSSYNANQSIENEILASDFMTLRTGGKENDLCVDAIIFKTGGVWKFNGKTWLRSIFMQQDLRLLAKKEAKELYSQIQVAEKRDKELEQLKDMYEERLKYIGE